MKSIGFAALTAVALATMAVAQSSPPVPVEYQDMYDELSADLAAFRATIDASWDGSRAPVAFSANLSSANASRGPDLLAPTQRDAVRHELDSLRALGVQAVTIAINFPVLFPPFHQSQADYQQYLDFYVQTAADVRARGLTLIVETQAIFSQGHFANWDVAPFYAGLTLAEYEQGRMTVARTIAEQLRPDYLSVIQEPDTEASQTGKPELNTVAGSTALLTVILGGLQAAAVPGVSVGAGFGTWQAGYADFAESFASSAIDFLDMHVYPVNRSFLPRALAIADVATSHGKQIGVTEGWPYKISDAELGVIPFPIVLGRDNFSFWAPLDSLYLQALVEFAHFKRLAFISPFWSGFFHAYVDYGPATQALPPAALAALAEGLQAASIAQGTYTPTGLAYLQAIVDPPDAMPPDAPPGFRVQLVSPTSVAILWDAAADNVGTATYEVYRDAVSLGRTAITSFVDGGLDDGREYVYAVEAIDASGNVSPVSTASITTPDTTAPSVPAGLQAAPTIVGSQIDLGVSWLPSTDNVGVTRYRVYRGTSPSSLGLIAITTDPSFSLTNVPPETTWYFAVSAVDAAWNDSGASEAVSVTTPSIPDITPPVARVPYPIDGSTIARTTPLFAVTWDVKGGLYDTPSGIAGVQFQIDGVDVGPEQTIPFSGTAAYSLFRLLVDTTTLSNGTHAISAVARDNAGNLTTAAAVTVTVENR